MLRTSIVIVLGLLFGSLPGDSRADQAVTLNGNEFAGVTNFVHVGYDPNAPISNFSAPNPTSNSVAYDVSLTSDANNVYILVQTDPSENADGTTGRMIPQNQLPPDFANLYLSTMPSAGTNIGVEVSTTGITDAFVPGGMSGYSIPTGESAVLFTKGTYDPTTGLGTGNSIEVGISWSFFTNDPDSIGFAKLAPGGTFQVRDSQSFGYTYVGGTTFGDARLGELTYSPDAVATPEPSTLVSASTAALLGLGFLWRKRRRAA